MSLGIANTRLKDFFDLWYLSRSFYMDGETLTNALSATFARRGTIFPSNGLPVALTEAFFADPTRRLQWQNFRRKVLGPAQSEMDTDLTQLGASLRVFLVPPLAALAVGEPFRFDWVPEHGWQPE